MYKVFFFLKNPHKKKKKELKIVGAEACATLLESYTRLYRDQL